MRDIRVAILGSTGSVGTQAIDVCRFQGWKVDFITGNSSIDILEKQIREFKPKMCAVSNLEMAKALEIKVKDTSTKILSGADGILLGIEKSDADVFVNSILGEAGLLPTLAVIKTGKRLALANKESLVIAGDLVKRELHNSKTKIVPVDSEHSAIFQCLGKAKEKEVKRILLTASGGPFFGYTKEQLRLVTKEMTLKHPTWNMGAKITVDSATMMNKGFEIIEAAHLFSVSPEQIQVVVHRESIIHSAVEFQDNTVIAELSRPDMRSCIQHAITYPKRIRGTISELDLFQVGTLSFFPPDEVAFPLLKLAKKCFTLGCLYPCALNAANEIAVDAFLNDKISFFDISNLVMKTIENFTCQSKTEYQIDDYLEADKAARVLAKSYLPK